MLGLRCQTIENLEAASSEIDFGTNLYLLGEFFEFGNISSTFLDYQGKFFHNLNTVKVVFHLHFVVL